MTAAPDPWAAPAASDEDASFWAHARQAEPVPPSFDESVSGELHKLKVRDAAREALKAEKAAQDNVDPFDAGTLGEILDRAAEPPHRAAGIVPSEAGTLIVAQRKTGKTTLELNYARCLITGEPFLGRFPMRPAVGTVTILNFEVSAAQLARWADDVGVDRERLYLVNLRGRRNPLSNADDRARLARQLRARGTEALIVDPFGRAYSGLSQNDPGEVSAWLSDLDRFARAEIGATDVVLAAHAGWDGERTRGSSALEDWADSIITLVRSKDDETQRFLHAIGRDVEVEEDRLEFDQRTRTLRLSGVGSRRDTAKTRKINELEPEVIAVVAAEPGISASAMVEALKGRGVTFQKGDESKAARNAVEHGWIRYEQQGRSRRYFPQPGLPILPTADTPTIPDASVPEIPVLPNVPQRPPILEKDIPHAPLYKGGISGG